MALVLHVGDINVQDEQQVLTIKWSLNITFINTRLRFARMPELKPAVYAESRNQSFFPVGDMVVTVKYDVQQRKRNFWSSEQVGTLKIETYRETQRNGDYPGKNPLEFNNDNYEFESTYVIPTNFKIGAEVAAVEQGLYGLVDDAVRQLHQRQQLRGLSREIRQDEHKALTLETKVEDVSEHKETPWDYDTIAQNLIKAIRHATGITSLSYEQFKEYQSHKPASIDDVIVQGKAPTDILAAVASYIDHNFRDNSKPKRVQNAVGEYLQAVYASQRVPASIAEQNNAAIKKHFVPQYLSIKGRYNNSGQLPDGIVDHAFESFFEGGIAGWIVLSWLGASVYHGITGQKVDIPGFYIGAATAFAWPYVKAPIGLATRGWLFRSRLKSLKKTVEPMLYYAPPTDDSAPREESTRTIGPAPQRLPDIRLSNEIAAPAAEEPESSDDEAPKRRRNRSRTR